MDVRNNELVARWRIDDWLDGWMAEWLSRCLDCRTYAMGQWFGLTDELMEGRLDDRMISWMLNGSMV